MNIIRKVCALILVSALLSYPALGMHWLIEVQKGHIVDHSAVNKFGRATNVDNGISTDVWDGANATTDQDIWIAPTETRIHDIASTSTSDDGNPAGVGARTLRIFGLTSWSTAETYEDIIFNGTSAVPTVNAYVIINRMFVLTKGATSVNVGTITATAQTDSTISAQIIAGQGQTHMAIYGIPSTHTAYVGRFYANVNKSGGATGAVDIHLCYNPEPESELTSFLKRHTFGIMTSGTSALTINYYVPKKFEGPGIIKIQSVGSANDLDVSAGFDFILVKN